MPFSLVAVMGNPAPKWAGIDGGQWLDWRSVRWVRGTAGFSTQNAVHPFSEAYDKDLPQIVDVFAFART